MLFNGAADRVWVHAFIGRKLAPDRFQCDKAMEIQPRKFWMKMTYVQSISLVYECANPSFGDRYKIGTRNGQNNYFVWHILLFITLWPKKCGSLNKTTQWQNIITCESVRKPGRPALR